MIKNMSILLFLSLTYSCFGFHVLDGEFTATKELPMLHSFKKNKPAANGKKTKINKKYKILGDNKPGGEWLQILDNDKKPQWVHKKWGEIKIKKLEHFDHFTLSLSWHPTFCLITSPETSEKTSSNKHHPFVLHGLWPSTKKRIQPAFCLGQILVEKCQFPPLKLNATLSKNLKSIMPGVDNCLDRYQWQKHGTCSGMDVNTYYTRSYDYTKWFLNSPVAQHFQKNMGKKVLKKQALSWFKEWSIEHAVSIHCIEHKNQYVLQEIHLYLNKKLAKTPMKTTLITSPYNFNTPDSFFLPQYDSNIKTFDPLNKAFYFWPKSA